MKPKVLLAVRAAVTIVLMAVLIYIVRDSIPKMFNALKHLPLSIFILGLLLFLLSVVIVSFRLNILLTIQGILLDVVNITKLNLIGYFFSSFLPTSVGGDVVKAFYISKASDKTMLSYTTVFIDRFLGMLTIFFIATCTLFYTKGISELYFKWLALFLFSISILFFIFLFNRRLADMLGSLLSPFLPAKIREKFKDIYNAMHNYKNHKALIIECLLISLAGQVVAFYAVSVFAYGLNTYIPLRFVLFSMSISSIISMLPSIYGMGPREMSIVIILGPLIGKDKALAVAFLWLGLLLTTAFLGGIIYIFGGEYKIRPSDVSP